MSGLFYFICCDNYWYNLSTCYVGADLIPPWPLLLPPTHQLHLVTSWFDQDPVEPPPTDQHCLLWSWPQGEVGSNPTHQDHNTLQRSLLLRGLVNKRLFCKYSDKTVICKLFWYTVNCGKRAELKKKFWVKIFCSFFLPFIIWWIYGEHRVSKVFSFIVVVSAAFKYLSVVGPHRISHLSVYLLVSLTVY